MDFKYSNHMDLKLGIKSLDCRINREYMLFSIFCRIIHESDWHVAHSWASHPLPNPRFLDSILSHAEAWSTAYGKSTCDRTSNVLLYVVELHERASSQWQVCLKHTKRLGTVKESSVICMTSQYSSPSVWVPIKSLGPRQQPAAHLSRVSLTYLRE